MSDIFKLRDFDTYLDKNVVEQFLCKYENVDSRARYEATIKLFINSIENKRIIDIKKDEIISFLNSIIDKEDKVYHMKEYLKFLINKRKLKGDIVNDGKFVEWVYNFRAKPKAPKRTAKKFSLNTIIKMDYDIKTNYKNPPIENKRDYQKKLKIALIWELLFDGGYQVGDLKELKARYLFDRKEYINSGEKNAIVDDYYDSKVNITKIILNSYKDNLLEYLKSNDRNDGFRSLNCLKDYCNDELQIYSGILPQDIIAARNKVFISCPNCGRKSIKLLSSNWVLVQYEKSHEKFLVCNNCKGNDIYGS